MKLFLITNLILELNTVNTCQACLSNQILKGFETRKSTGMILIDLQKAFGTFDQQTVLKKLNYIGFSPETVRWFESYLKNRNHIASLSSQMF